MLFVHKTYTCIYSAAGGHSHSCADTVKVTDPEAMDLDGMSEEPSVLPSGTWRISCTPECEQHILRRVQYVGATEKGIPLTKDEEAEVRAESQRSNVEVATMARALSQIVRAGTSA